MSTKKENKKTTTSSPLKRRYILFIWLTVLSPIIFMSLILLIRSFGDLPSIQELENPDSFLATEVYTQDGEVIGKYFKQNRTNTKYYEISPYVLNALMATEDERFYQHSGVDPEAILRAVARMGSGGGGSTITQQLAKMQFTEKPASNIQERIWQKLGEWIISWKLEKRFTKEEVITMYLNQFDFLNNAVGINSAAKVYFNTTPKKLKIEQAAMLVGMAKNPSLFNPIRRPDTVLHRRMIVLFQMEKNGYITQKEYDSLRVLPLGLTYTKVDHKDGKAPYFREILRQEVSELLETKDEDGNYLYLNKDAETPRPYDIYKDGLKIYSTLDSRMQEYAEWAMEEHLKTELQLVFEKQGKSNKKFPYSSRIEDEEIEKDLETSLKRTSLYRKITGQICAQCERTKVVEEKVDGRAEWVCSYSDCYHREPKLSAKEIEDTLNNPRPTVVFSWTSKNHEKDTVMSPKDEIKYNKKFLRSSMMSMDPNTGYVKAWVGGPDFKFFQYDGVKTGRNQVGSTFKPFVYASAIHTGIVTPCEKVLDIEHCVEIPYGENMKSWCPKNGSKYSGNAVSLRKGLASSMNNITAYLIGKTGPQNVVDIVERMGIQKGSVQATPSMALGVYDLSVFEMVGAMSTFVNRGVYIKPTMITRIEDRHGNVIYEHVPEMQEVFDWETAYITLQLMRGVVEGGTATRIRYDRPYGNIKYPIAGKTGTTQSNSDGWFMGLTPDLVTGVWTGGEHRGIRFASTNYGQGANSALPIFGYFMNKVYKDSTLKISKENFEKPPGMLDPFTNCSQINDDIEIDENIFNGENTDDYN